MISSIRKLWPEYLMLVFTASILTFFTHQVWTVAEAQASIERPEPRAWTPRKIPKCDKELWLRIKDGC